MYYTKNMFYLKIKKKILKYDLIVKYFKTLLLNY